ncbi:LOW QUALITY PROTEIN: hypothetical protein PHMEG_00019145 [Phytophthora megakarya]|uniref:Eukaryotic/viral aspartic protease n=1 Tax=Phytophthora megakarya TaxID=4795 RepID=A0A225VTJ7_9STRA|nr:LOW QUALITY PROTEIN: hypothetical protein PHMEG_00019145 [Phytophthora megakarya]
MICKKYFAPGSGQNPTEEGWVLPTDRTDPTLRNYLAANQDATPKEESETIMPDPGPQDPGSINISARSTDPRSRCGKRGQSADHCLFVCRGCGELHDMGKCPMEGFYNQIRQWFNPTKYTGMFPLQEDAKLGCSSGRNPIRAERSSHCIYAFVHKPSVAQVSEQRHLPDNTRDLHGNHTFVISSLRQADEYSRSDVTMTVDLHPGESRGYWKQQDPDLWFKLPRPRGLIGSQSIDDLDPRRHWISYLGDAVDIGSILLLWFRQAEIGGKTHNEKAILLLGTGTEVGCYIDSNQMQNFVWISALTCIEPKGSTRIKMTLAGFLVYFFDIYISLIKKLSSAWHSCFWPRSAWTSLPVQSLPDEVRIQLSGRRQLYSDKVRIVNFGQHLRFQPGELVELPFRLRTSDHEKFWVTRGDHWVPTVANGAKKIRYMRTCGSGSGWPAILSHDNSSHWGPGTIWSGRIWTGKGPWNPDLQIRKIHLCLGWSTPSMELRVEYCNGQGRRRSSV